MTLYSPDSCFWQRTAPRPSLLASTRTWNGFFQPTAFRTACRASFHGVHVLGPEPKVLQERVRNIKQADRMSGSSFTFTQSLSAASQSMASSTTSQAKKSKFVNKSTKSQSPTSMFDRLGFLECVQRQDRATVSDQSFRGQAGGRGQHSRPAAQQRWKEADSAQSASSKRQWRCDGWGTSGRFCSAVGEPAGRLPRLQDCRAGGERPQFTQRGIAFRTRNSMVNLQQVIDSLSPKGAVHEKSLGFYSRLFRVPKKTGDLCPVIDLSAHNDHMVIPHFKMEAQSSVKMAIMDQHWAVSIDIMCRCTGQSGSFCASWSTRRLTNSRVFHLVWPLHPGSSQN